MKLKLTQLPQKVLEIIKVKIKILHNKILFNLIDGKAK